jgi:hypothetical protein
MPHVKMQLLIEKTVRTLRRIVFGQAEYKGVPERPFPS